MLSIPLKKPIFGIVALGSEIIIALFSTTFAFPFAVIFGLLLLATGGEASGITARPKVQCTIVAVNGPLAGRRYVISENQKISFGRENCGILFPINTPGIGRHHCFVYMQNQTAFLVDNQSTYGTYLLPSGNRLPSQTPVSLSENTQFCLASSANIFQVNYTSH